MQTFSDIKWRLAKGPTLYSHGPAVFLRLSQPAPPRRAEIVSLWPDATAALIAGLAQIGLDTGLIDKSPAPENNGDVLKAAAGLAGRLAVSLLREAQAPGLDFGFVQVSEGAASVFWNDWMDGLGLVAGAQSLQLLDLAFTSKSDLKSACAESLKAVYDARVDAFMSPMIFAAERRGIPWRSLHPRSSFLVYGQGARQQIFYGTMNGQQSRATVHLTQCKHLSVGLLRAAGLPVPDHRVATTREEAISAAAQLGAPLVVKPDAGSRAENIYLNLTAEAEILAAFNKCRKVSRRVLVEKQYPGLPYRVTVCDGRAVATARHALPMVRGDDRSTIAELIEAWNRQHQRPVADHYRLPLPIDQAFLGKEMTHALAQQSLPLDAVPEKGREVFLALVPSLMKGGLHENLTERCHPDTLALAEEAARVLDSRNLSVDFITPDITRPHDEVPLVINEVNAAPSPRTHILVHGQAVDLSDQLFAQAFPDGGRGRIPLALSLGRAEFLAPLRRLLTATGQRVGYADSRTAEVDGYQLKPAEGQAVHPGIALLRDRRPDCAIIAVEISDFILPGLPSDHLDFVAIPERAVTDRSATADRRAIETLVGLPGQSLALPLEMNLPWIIEAAQHRQVILVDENRQAPVQELSGTTVVTWETAPEGRRLIARHDRIVEPLAEHFSPVESGPALAWSAAALLGLGYSADTIRLLVAATFSPAAAEA